MSNFTLDWKAIRPLNGGREKGFEELCSQLARNEAPTATRFVRKGTPDAGVECYTVFSDESEWAWQSKYFTSMGEPQWTQLDKSVETAIEKHPRLVRYYICVPLDLPDARIPGRMSAKERWDARIEKWNGWALAAGMTIEFVFWGSSEMLERLAYPKHAGRVQFWFGQRRFDEDWFKFHLEQALSAAGPRYTPEIHVELPIAHNFNAFGRTQHLFDTIKSFAIPIRERLQAVHHVKAPLTSTDIKVSLTHLFTTVDAALHGVSALKVTPTDSVPFEPLLKLIDEAQAAAQELSSFLKSDELRSTLRMRDELHKAGDEIRHVAQLVGSNVLLLCGDAGSGKTHLLCDVVKNRINAGLPTILLMGQRFVSKDPPWTQVLQQLDLVDLSNEQFIGALEAAAQASGQRALLIIDAVNEGAGRTIWPSHMAAFLTQIQRSAWIGVVMSVRASYKELIVPQQVIDNAAVINHYGFRGHEYDATKTFFIHYELELPSTPLLAPEFSNPLFLKTLCQGLKAKGETRLPRGLHRITMVFELYLKAINQKLARELGYDQRTSLVRRALDTIATVMSRSSERWISLEDAKSTVDTLLPGRDFEQSLYRNLVVEGILHEDLQVTSGDSTSEVVYVAYDRLADYLIAKTLLDKHLDQSNPASSFGAGRGLAFINDPEQYIAPGLLEALWVQIAERCDMELIALAPLLTGRECTGKAFRQSLIWRATDRFSDSTYEVLNSFCQNEDDEHETLDVLLTLATLPQHPLNIQFLDRRLRKDSMAERDTWWSVYLHHAWGQHGPVDRLVDWASSLTPETLLEDEVVELAGTTLTWMLTCSNRFLRDRVTKALVSMYTGRISNVGRLVAQFTQVGDLYITERVYAVAYGVVMRSHNLTEVGSLAKVVYENVFAPEHTPAHILLRDYARGVVERAIHLNADLEIDETRIRPPYSSQWPRIPSKDEIEALSNNSGGWAYQRIVRSVLGDDFARYVIGTNSSSGGNWLAIEHDMEWEPPPSPSVLREGLVADLSPEERIAWDEFAKVDKEHGASVKLREFIDAYINNREISIEPPLDDDLLDEDLEDIDFEDINLADINFESTQTSELDAGEVIYKEALAKLESALSSEHAERLSTIREMESLGQSACEPPRLQLKQIQHYVLKRVFELGWTEERFEHFDHFVIGYDGREASKAERVGKKYQWIAYHEILAFVSDQFQYQERHRREDGDKKYKGPWQNNLRDIDPSCTLRSPVKNLPMTSRTSVWWGPTQFNTWCVPGAEEEWLLCTSNLPKVEELLCRTNPNDGVQWLVAQSDFKWEQQGPAERRSWESDRGQLWYRCTGYLIRKCDVDEFLQWAEGVDFWEQHMPDTVKNHEMFLGEHAWSPASQYFEQPYHGDNGWAQLNQDSSVKMRATALEYWREASGFDCSIDETYPLCLPVRELIETLALKWTGKGADFIDASGELAAYDPSTHTAGPSTLLLRKNLVRDPQLNEALTLCWVVRGEQQILMKDWDASPHPRLKMSGAYALKESGLCGFVKHTIHTHGDPPSEPRLISTYRKP